MRQGQGRGFKPLIGGLFKNMVYDDVRIRNVKNPIYVDSNYSFPGEATDHLPHFTGISSGMLRYFRLES